MNVTEIAHVGIATADLQRARDFYVKRLGIYPRGAKRRFVDLLQGPGQRSLQAA